MNNNPSVDRAIEFISEKLKNAESGHDYWHSIRVWKFVKKLSKNENIRDSLSVELAALLHDIADHKFSVDIDSDKNIIVEFLHKLQLSEKQVNNVIFLIENVSFSSDTKNDKSIELAILQDADRLDAIGAIGIARAFSYGGYKKREFYNPDIPPNINMTKEEYKKSKSTTINHFYEKLLLLKDQMNTKSAKEMAEKRHSFMLEFIEQFMMEWESD